MRAIRLYGVGQLRVEAVPAPDVLAPGDVCIRVQAAGICGSDLFNFRTGRRISRLPVTPGHEVAGEIIGVGTYVSNYRPGDVVVADSRVPCGMCKACEEGRETVCQNLGYLGEVCDGAFADFVSLPSVRLLKVPSGISPWIAALSEPLSVALHLIRRLNPSRNNPILIGGTGPIGGLAAILLDHLGFGPLFIIDRNVDRAKLVTSVTGAEAIPADSAVIASRTGPSGLRYAIEATGASAMLSLLANSMAGGGRLALVGMFRGECVLDLNSLIEREVEIVGCSVFRDEQSEALGLLGSLGPKLERVISIPISLEEVPMEYHRLLSGQSPTLKSIVCP
jgi:(R,R)-butanediol dehydrogenase/meso-butanediol dehydrogenase/diacetyl reductase